MPGTATHDPPPAPRGTDAAVFGVYRYVPGTKPPLEPLPWVLFMGDQRRAGHQPPVARYRYDFRDDAPPGWPRRIEDVYPYQASSEYAIKADDRIVTLRFRQDGAVDLVRDGWAHLPQANASPGSEVVTITCHELPTREFDEPLAGAIMRDESLEFWGKPPTNTGAKDFQTAEPVHFNPGGRPNATPKDDGTEGAESADSGDAGNPSDPLDPDHPRRQYPVFVTPGIKTDRTPPARLWTLGMAVRYLVLVGNPKERWVHNTDLSGIDDRLRAMRPKEAGGVIDPDDPATYEFEDIIVPDVDVTGMAWAEAVVKLIEPHGFVFRWTLADQLDEAGHPYHAWIIYRKDTAAKRVRVRLQKAGESLDFNKTNVEALALGREFPTANVVRVLTTPRLYQADFILVPKFEPLASDLALTKAQREARFKKGGSEYKDHLDDYRVWIFAEDDSKWWDEDTHAWGTRHADLTPLFDPEGDLIARKWCRRRRAPRRDLVTTDPRGKPLEAELWISTDWGIDTAPTVSGNLAPMLWDSKFPGTWQRVTHGQWSLLVDRVGIRLQVENPESWPLGLPPSGGASVMAGGKVNVLVSTIAPQPSTGLLTGPNRRFWLRLTCVIEADVDLEIQADKRVASPTSFDIWRYREARDRYQRGTVSVRGHLGGASDEDGRDDTPAAKAYADALRRQEELGHFSGSVTIGWFSDAYEVGNVVEKVEGRDISLDGAAAAEQKEGAVYPTIVGIDRNTEAGSEGTTLHLADVRNEGAIVPWEATPKVVESPAARAMHAVGF